MKTMTAKERTRQMMGVAAGLAVGSDDLVAEAAREARPEAADAAAMLFAQAVKSRMDGRMAFGRWLYARPAEERATLEAVGAAVAKRKGLPEEWSTARVLKAYYEGRELKPKRSKREAKRKSEGRPWFLMR